MKTEDYSSRKGYTLVELIVVISIVALVAAGAAVTLAQVMKTHGQNRDSSTAVRMAQTAGYWTSQDAVMASSIDVGDDGSTAGTEFATMRWQHMETGNISTVRYLLEPFAGSLYTIRRVQVVTDKDGAQLSSRTTFVSNSILSADLQWISGNRWKLTVQARAGTKTVTREYEVLQRPNYS